MTAINFDAEQVEPNEGFKAIPAGEYRVTIKDVEDKVTKKGDGKYAKFTFEVLGGEQNGKKVFANLNLWNKSAVAVEIAQGDLSAICRAVNMVKITDLVQLRGTSLMVDVAVQNDPRYNEIKKYFAIGAASSTTTPQDTSGNNGFMQ